MQSERKAIAARQGNCEAIAKRVQSERKASAKRVQSEPKVRAKRVRGNCTTTKQITSSFQAITKQTGLPAFDVLAHGTSKLVKLLDSKL